MQEDLREYTPVLIFALIISLIYLTFGILNDTETIFNSSFFSLFDIKFFFIHINEDYFFIK